MGRRAQSERRSPMSGRDSFRSAQTGDTGCARSCHKPSRGHAAAAARIFATRTSRAGRQERGSGVGFEICLAIDNGDVSLGAGDIDGETGRQRRSARTLDRDETVACAGIALNHEPDPPGTKYADPVEQDEPIGNVVEAPRHPSLAHPILHSPCVKTTSKTKFAKSSLALLRENQATPSREGPRVQIAPRSSAELATNRGLQAAPARG